MDGPPPEAVDEAMRVEALADDDSVLLRRIGEEFPGWGVWRSDTGRWWAFRTSASPLTIQQIRAGCRLIVQADTAEKLREAIRDEIDCASRAGD